MKNIKTNNFTTKKFFALALGFVLLIATVFGILFGTHRNAHAEDDRPPITINGSLNRHMSEDKDYPDYHSIEITDRGIFNNHFCPFNCDEQFPDIGDFISRGFTYVTVTLEFYMREVNEGYQHVYLYSHSNQLEEIKMNYYGSKTQKNYNYVAIKFKTRDLSEFFDTSINKNMDLEIRYNASGVGADNWRFKNLIFRVQLSQGTLRAETEVIGNV